MVDEQDYLLLEKAWGFVDSPDLLTAVSSWSGLGACRQEMSGASL